MASTQQIRRRIRTVKNTKQITKAMELVAASKMRRAQEATLLSRAYRNTARDILYRLRELTNVEINELYVKRDIKTRLHILITSNRGLAGAYNSNMLREFAKQLESDKKNAIASKTIVIGRKGARFVSRIKNIEVVGVYDEMPDSPDSNDLKPIVETVFEQFKTGEVDAVDIHYTDFKSSISQVVESQRLLPAAFEDEDIEHEPSDEVFEPSPEVVLESITPKLVEVQILQAFLESAASEHSMRMLAMKSATDNATDLIGDLTLEFNGARQAAITQELAEITGGAEAIS